MSNCFCSVGSKYSLRHISIDWILCHLSTLTQFWGRAQLLSEVGFAPLHCKLGFGKEPSNTSGFLFFYWRQHLWDYLASYRHNFRSVTRVELKIIPHGRKCPLLIFNIGFAACAELLCCSYREWNICKPRDVYIGSDLFFITGAQVPVISHMSSPFHFIIFFDLTVSLNTSLCIFKKRLLTHECYSLAISM